MAEDVIHQLFAVARAAHGWSEWRRRAEATGDFTRTREIDELERAAERALASLARIGPEQLRQGPSLGGATIDPDDIVTLCATCKRARIGASQWVALEEYLHSACEKWASHTLCASCADEMRAALAEPAS